MTTTDPDRSAFLAAIAANPEDAVARLAYADWLDERGDHDAAKEQRLAVVVSRIREAPDDDAPRLEYAALCEHYGDRERAEFVRVQCELAALDQVDRTCPYIKDYARPEPGPLPVERWRLGYCTCRGCVLARKEGEIADKYIRDCGPWTKQLLRAMYGPKWLQLSAWLQLEYARGFVARVSGPLAAFGEERECGCDDGSVDTGGVTPWGESITDCCPHCRGTGRVWLPAPAFADLCRREPLPDDGASVTDLDLLTMPIGLERRRISRPIGTLPAEGFLGEVPVSLFDLIPCPPERTLTFYKSFDSEGELRVALSTALVRAARSPKGD